MARDVPEIAQGRDQQQAAVVFLPRSWGQAAAAGVGKRSGQRQGVGVIDQSILEHDENSYQRKNDDDKKIRQPASAAHAVLPGTGSALARKWSGHRRLRFFVEQEG